MLSGKSFRIEGAMRMRRRYQTGHIFARGKRRRLWVARYSEPVLKEGKVTAVLRSRVIGPCADFTKSQAHSVLEGWLRPLNDGSFTPTQSSRFEAFYQKWENDLLPTYRESTRRFYQDTARRWVLPYFKDWPMVEIT